MGEEAQEYKIDAEGSLGLLALGDIGLQLWREEVEKMKAENKESENKDE